MCQSLVEKAGQSKQLRAISDPNLLILFEDWLEELEGEVISLAGEHAALTPSGLAEKFGISLRGATFLLSKLRQEGKIEG